MDKRYKFNRVILNSIIGGRSIIDLPRLNITNLVNAHRFIGTYGYDLENETELDQAWAIYHRAIDLMKTYVLESDQELPTLLSTKDKLEDLGHLLVFASGHDGNEMQKWSCSLLRIMHVIAHLENDPFHSFSEEIQRQILKPFKEFLHKDPVHGYILGHQSSSDRIDLKRFDVKTYKGIDSASVKLLAKRSETAMSLMDRIGIRFVTNSIYDSFRVLRFLHKEYIVSVANLVPDQANNTLYPLNLFLEVMEEARSSNSRLSDDELQSMLVEKISSGESRAEFKEKKNDFSGADYRVIKFISRVRVKLGDEHQHRFFYPFEIQIMDYDTYTKLQSGPSEHSEYKKRQAQAAKERVQGLYADI